MTVAVRFPFSVDGIQCGNMFVVVSVSLVLFLAFLLLDLVAYRLNMEIKVVVSSPPCFRNREQTTADH
jgi:hypothetical protein